MSPLSRHALNWLQQIPSPQSALPPMLSVAVDAITIFPFARCRNAEVLLDSLLSFPPATVNRPVLLTLVSVICQDHLRVSIFTSSTSVQATSIFHPDGGSLFPFSPFHTAARITISNHKMSGVDSTEWQSVLQLLVFVSAPTHPLGLRLNATSLNHFFPDDFHSILYLIFIMSIRIMMYQIFCVTIYLISALPGKLGSIEGEGSV